MDERLARIKFLRDQLAEKRARNGQGQVVSLESWLNRPADRLPYNREYTNIQWILDGGIKVVLLKAEALFDIEDF